MLMPAPQRPPQQRHFIETAEPFDRAIQFFGSNCPSVLQRIRHLPVVENGELRGIVSSGDVVKQRLEEVQSEAEELRSYIRSP